MHSLMRRAISRLLLLAAAIAALAPLRGGEPAAGLPGSCPLPTMGGLQFWGDELFFHQWRIQRNSVIGQCRLLDGDNVQRAFGSYDHCLDALNQIKRRQKLPPMKGKAVVLLHGLACSRAKMEPLAKYLHDRGGYAVFNVSYPSTQGDVAAHAKALKHVLDHLDGIAEINFVGHSLGNIVIRHYLADETDRLFAIRPDRRIKRFVMLGPPNHGSTMAQAAALTGVFEVVTGSPGIELGWDWQQLEKKLATPACPFAVIAGGKGDGRGLNPLLPGDNDGIISVETTRLAGAADFAVVPVFHHFLPDDAKVQEYTLRFCSTGILFPRGSGSRSPPRKQPDADELTPAAGKGILVLMCANPSPKPPGRIAGVDYGAVRIGVAISDREQHFASPLENYSRRTPELDARKFKQLAAEEEIVLWVVGLPVHSRRPRKPEIAGSTAIRPMARRSDRRARRLLRRAIHESAGGGTSAGRRTDEKTPQKAVGHARRPDHALRLPRIGRQGRRAAPGTGRSAMTKQGGEEGDRSMFSDRVADEYDADGPKNGPVPARPAKLIVGCGYLGRRVAQQWLAAGESVVGVVARDEHAAELQRLGVRPLVADVTRPATLAQLPPAETVLYAVGYDPRGGRTRREVYLEGLRNTLAALPSTPERVIFISSTGVYGQNDGSWVDEDSPCRPRHEAGRALLAAERLLQRHPLGSRGIVLRLTAIYGPGRLSRPSACLAGVKQFVPADMVVNLIHVDDAAAVVIAAESRAPLPRTYFVADGQPVPVREYITYFYELLGLAPPQFTDEIGALWWRRWRGGGAAAGISASAIGGCWRNWASSWPTRLTGRAFPMRSDSRDQEEPQMNADERRKGIGD